MMKKYKKIVWILFFLVLCFACQRKNYYVQKPTIELSQQQVENILYDIYILEGQCREKLFNNSSNIMRTYVIEHMNTIMNKYGVTYKDFEANLDYYYYDNEKLKEIQINVTNRLLQDVAKIEKQIKSDSIVNIHKNDSLKLKQSDIKIKQLPIKSL